MDLTFVSIVNTFNFKGVEMMTHLLAAVVAVGLAAATPTPRQPVWDDIASSKVFKISLDLKSVDVKADNTVHSQLKVTYNVPIPVKGKKKTGHYYIEQVTANCGADKLVVTGATLFSKDGEPLAQDDHLNMDLPNNHIDGTFVTSFMDLMCNGGKNTIPAINV